MDAGIILTIVCVLIIAYSIFVIISRFRIYRRSTDEKEKRAKLIAVIMAAVLAILVVVFLIGYYF